jgi:oxygen-dependent protoporphyrinogen oxidase
MAAAFRRPAPIAIIGGGISGLAAAYELTTRGIPFVLFERALRLGGVVHTESVDGYTIDGGPDALLTQKPAALDLCAALGLGSRLQPQAARSTFVVRDGRLRRLPEASVLGIPTRWLPFVTTGAFSLRGKLRMAAEALLPRGAASSGDESIASFIGRRFGQEAVDYLAEPLLAGIHGGDPARLSMRLAFPRLLELEARYRSVIVGLRKGSGRRRQQTSAGSPFVALPGGMRELTDTLAAAVPASSIRRGVPVRGLERTANGFVLRFRDGTSQEARAVMLAVPPPAASCLVESFDRDLDILIARIRMASVATVALGYRRDAVRRGLGGSGFVVPRRERLSVRAVSWVSSKWPGRAPEGRVLLRAFLGGVFDPHALDLDDGVLVDRAAGDVARLLGIGAEPELARVYRFRDATPQLEVGHHDLMGAIEGRLAAHPGLFLTASGFRGTGIADCVADGRAQAVRAADYVFARASEINDRTLTASG